ncbi:AbrB family transcriptional regulator [Aureimonas glaciei]|uniref:AbrB family transcriptional regulator n=2 Tax=Aureimonas glaciei TaxID=1776957 RepID=A0A917D7X8_9HYPH|nr:AbrB family transcriptional regulator [Aureimonas glaciei]
MDMAIATITSKGQVTLPKALRERLQLKAGDQIDFVEVNGNVVLRPRHVRALDLIGILKPVGDQPVSLDAMDAAIGEAVVHRYERSLDRD